MEYRKPIKELKEKDFKTELLDFLRANNNIAFSYKGIMNEMLKIDKKKIESVWKKPTINAYYRIRRNLATLVIKGQVNMKLDERKNWFWIDN